MSWIYNNMFIANNKILYYGFWILMLLIIAFALSNLFNAKISLIEINKTEEN